jgi:hypothetical protein
LSEFLEFGMNLQLMMRNIATLINRVNPLNAGMMPTFFLKTKE